MGCRMNRPEIKIVVLLFSLLAAVYFISAKGYLSTSDSIFSLRTAMSIVERGALDIQIQPNEKEYVYTTKEGKNYSQYGIGLVFLWVPFAALGRVAHFFTGVKSISVADFLASYYNVFFGAGTCILLFLLIRLLKGPAKTGLHMAAALGLATMWWRYSVWDPSEVAQGFFLLGCVLGLAMNSGRGILYFSLSFAALLLMKVASIIYLPVFLVFFLLQDKITINMDRRKLFMFFLFPILAICLLFLLNYIRFGNILETGYGYRAWKFSQGKILKNIWQMFFSLEKGLFVYNPVLILSLFCLPGFLRRTRKLGILILAILATNFLFYAMWQEPVGGLWSWGPRYFVPMLPLWLLPLFILVEKSGGLARKIVFLVILISLPLQLISVLQCEHEYFDIRYRLQLQDQRLAEKLPPDIIGVPLLLKHKLLKKDNLYKLSEFSLDSDQLIDTSADLQYQGLDLWYCYLARKFKLPFIKIIPFIILPFIFIYSRRLFFLANEFDNLYKRQA